MIPVLGVGSVPQRPTVTGQKVVQTLFQKGFITPCYSSDQPFFQWIHPFSELTTQTYPPISPPNDSVPDCIANATKKTPEIINVGLFDWYQKGGFHGRSLK